MIAVKYIGAKASKDLTLNGVTIAAWACLGDIQQVDEKHIAAIAGHPTVWRVMAAEDLAAPPDQDVVQDDAEDDAPLPAAGDGLAAFERFESGGNVLQLREIESGDVIDLTHMDDGELKAFARKNGIKADLRRRGDELRSSIVAVVITSADTKE